MTERIEHLCIDQATPGRFLFIATNTAVVQYDLVNRDFHTIDLTLQAPIVANVGRGNIVIHSGQEARLFRVDEDMDRATHRVSTPGREVIAALPGPNPGKFTLIDRAGKVTIHDSTPGN